MFEACLVSSDRRREQRNSRLGTPEGIANVVSFLAGPDAGWINAQTLRVNGGYT